MGAICAWCKQDMLACDGCSGNERVDYPEGTALPSIPYGSEGRAKYGRDDDGNLIADKRCHDCNVLVGNKHHPGCDVEECPQCHAQLISCGCLESDDD